MSNLEISDFRFYVTSFVKDFLSEKRMDLIKPLIRIEYIDWLLTEIEEEGVKQKYHTEKEDLLEKVKDNEKVEKYFNQFKNKRKQIIDEFSDRLVDLKAEIGVIPLAPFPYNEYNYIVAIEIKLGRVDTSGDPKPFEIFNLSRQIKRVMNEINEGENPIWCDHLNLHPYAVVVADSRDGKTGVVWDKNEIESNKRLLGSWVEYYSGQWDDYSEELYDERIYNNLSNRTSELHYIRSNSAFIYMERKDPRWKDWLYGYM